MNPLHKSPILVLGPKGYLGSAFCIYLQATQRDYAAESWRFSHQDDLSPLHDMLSYYNPKLVINCIAYIPQPTVDACKDHPDRTIQTNIIFPLLLAKACERRGVPLMHLSTGCLYDEQNVYRESDMPTRGWPGNCGCYVGGKLMAEKYVTNYRRGYVLRLRLPFDHLDSKRNYLSKLANFSRVYDHVNSLTHRGDFVRAAIELFEKQAPFGIYHLTNPGFVSAAEVIEKMIAHKLIGHLPQIVKSETTGCKLATDKLSELGIAMRPVKEALDDALTNWQKAKDV